MKLLNKFSISPKNQLKKNIFVYIVLILFCLLLVFLLVGNLDNILRSIHETNRVETDNRAEYQAVVKLSEKLEKEHIAQAKQDTAVEKTVVWGTSTASYKAVALQLNNMKEDFRTEEQLEECAGAEILFVCKTDFNDQEIQMLEEYSRAGAALFFTEIPSEAALEKKSVKDLLGIDTYKGIQEKKGIRLTENLLFGEITESRESFTMKSVTLKRQAEVYGSALQSKKVKNENLAPVFWRYQSSAEGGSIYMADRELMAGTMVYAVVSFLFTDLYQAYMYPIVNAYCFAVSGMPYTDEFTSEYLEKEYQRDSMGVQNDIFFPEFRRCEERYGVKTTWYTDEREEIKKYSNAMFAYYLEGIVEGNNEIGTLNNYSLKREVDSPFDNRLVLWNSDFEWTDKLTDSVCIPYRALTEKKYQNIIFHDKGICRGMGLNTVFTDISPFLYETDEKKQERWIDYCRNLETVLGVEKEDIPWLERVTVGEAVYRVKAFQMMEPEIRYSDKQIDAVIGNFAGKAYFYLSLPADREIKGAEGATVTRISDVLYLVEAEKANIRITYEE